MSYTRSSRLLSSLFLATLLVTAAQASDFQSARTLGLGGAGHAAPILTDAIYMNPAMISFLNAYSVTVTRNAYSGPEDSEPRGNVTNFSIQDGTNQLLQAGLGYTRRAYGKAVHVGASTRVFEKYGVGVGGKFLFDGGPRDSAQDATVSALGSPTPWLQTSLIVDNVIESSKSKAWGQRREVIVGIKANIEKIMLVYFDPHFLPSKPNGDSLGYEAGLELPVFSDLYIRGGLNRNSFQHHIGGYGRGHAVGLGWSFPRLSLDAAMARTISPQRTNNFIFSITII